MSKSIDLIAKAVELYAQNKRSSAALARELHPECTEVVSFDYFRQLVGKAIKEHVAGLPKSFTDMSTGFSEAFSKDTPIYDDLIEPEPFVFSAVHPVTGRLMDMDEYCLFYNLPKDEVISYKLVTHTGTPFYNTLFKDIVKINGIISEDFIESTIKKFVRPVFQGVEKLEDCEGDWFDRLIYTDAHIGMDTNKDGIAMYATPWGREAQLERVDVMIDEVIKCSRGNVLYVDELGDFMDGWNGFTTRGGHPLPQNMSNEQAFDVGIEFKMRIIDRLLSVYNKIYLNNICNDNHAGAFGYVVNSTVKKICEAKYPGVVIIENHRQFINHYFVGRHAFVITHGKDGKSLKFGFKPKLDAIQIEKIDAYLKRYDVYRRADFIEFSKGDSHQMLLDYCTSDDFTYFNYPAFSPSSEWVQNNFKKGRSGFVIQHVKYNENEKSINPKFF